MGEEGKTRGGTEIIGAVVMLKGRERYGNRKQERNKRRG